MAENSRNVEQAAKVADWESVELNLKSLEAGLDAVVQQLEELPP
jgi:hypothetical protein